MPISRNLELIPQGYITGDLYQVFFLPSTIDSMQRIRKRKKELEETKKESGVAEDKDKEKEKKEEKKEEKKYKELQFIKIEYTKEILEKEIVKLKSLIKELSEKTKATINTEEYKDYAFDRSEDLQNIIYYNLKLEEDVYLVDLLVKIILLSINQVDKPIISEEFNKNFLLNIKKNSHFMDELKHLIKLSKDNNILLNYDQLIKIVGYLEKVLNNVYGDVKL